jgi:hypothetical protein
VLSWDLSVGIFIYFFTHRRRISELLDSLSVYFVSIEIMIMVILFVVARSYNYPMLNTI